ncbi:hypothetical protein GCM10010123_29210 [Pilimelia anulata]|uniref:Uncharacterized protein n=1 Tax=Pilimelia anulata TaxID=53371 RepID=A0A8J3BAQ4_9ACTN|nr:hypothetical protein [Pilimelia anulata]GGJ97363.1 hypothetical protein GCM10010123_29210 [Pilimelia anulata]
MRVTGRLLVGFLRSRYGVALALAVVVVGILATTSLLAPPRQDASTGPPVDPIPTVHPTVGDDGEKAPPAPRLAALPGASPPERVARTFAATWLTGPREPAGWRDRLRPMMTAGLAEKFADADPASVPATALGGAATVTALNEYLAEAAVPTRRGQLKLRLLADGGRWLVDAVDWEPT